VRESIRRNRWGMLSILVTIVNAVLIFTLVRYLYWRGLWAASGGAHSALSIWGVLSIVLSLVTAIVGLVRDSSKGLGVVALCLSLFSFVFYVQ
jgi:hypothetical protein